MHSSITSAFLLVALAIVGCEGGADDASVADDVGISCTTGEECGSLDCLCVVGEGDVPGVCSTTCASDDDCAKYGEEFSCSLDFCTGVSVCLNLVN